MRVRKERTLFLQRHEIERRDVAAGLAVDHEIAAGGETVQAGLEGVFADLVVHDIDPAAGGDAAGFFGDVGLGGHDDLVGASFGDSAGFFGGGTDTDHAGSAKLCHLAEQQADASSGGVNEAPIAGLDRVGKVREGAGEESLIHSGGGLFDGEIGGNGDEPGRGD